jgi:hypothetical protein
LQINFDGVDIKTTQCTCARGKILCHHTTAVLYQLVHFKVHKLTKVPVTESKTSVPQVKKSIKATKMYTHVPWLN